MTKGSTLTIGGAIVLVALLILFTFGGKVTALFETADVRLDTAEVSLESPAAVEAAPTPTGVAKDPARVARLEKEAASKGLLAYVGTAGLPSEPGADELDLNTLAFDGLSVGDLRGGAGPASAGSADMSVPLGGFNAPRLRGTQPMPAAAPRPKKSGYLSSEYVGGSGQLDRMAKLVDEGIVLDGRTVKLGALTASYHQPIAVPADRALVAFAKPEHTKISTDGGTTHLQVGIQAANRELPKRPAVQLVLVVDTSGSMERERKMEFALLAASQLVDALLPTDQLAIITYDDNPNIVLPLAPRGDGGAARAAIVTSFVAGGSTNISGALDLAYAHLSPQRDPDAISRVVLLSDGNPTAGITDPSHIRKLAYDAFQDGLQTTTLGVGLDFNSDLMMTIAREGKGNYHFVKDGGAIAGVLDEELDQLTHVVAQAVRLRIELPDNVGLVRVLGAEVLDETASQQVRTEERNLDRRISEELGIAENRVNQKDEGLKLVVPSFHMGKHHIVMLELDVPAGTDPIDVATVEVKYKDLLSRTNREETLTATVQRAASKSEAVSSLDSTVKKNLLGFQTGEALLRAGQFVDRGYIDAATKEIDDQMALLGVAADRWRDSDLERDAELLGAYKEVIAAQRGGGLGPQARQYLSRALSYSGYKLTR